MANEMKAADLIGKRINVGGEGSKSYYVVKCVDGEKVTVELHRGEAAPMELPMMWSALKGMIDKGTLSIAGEAPAGSATDEVEVAEVVDIHPTVKPKPKAEPKPKSEKPAKAKTESKPKAVSKREESGAGSSSTEREQARRDSGKAEPKSDGGKLTYSTYTSKKGKTCAKISGFGENDPAYVNAAELHGSSSWDNKKGKKVLYLAFGHKYVAAAKLVCEALNAGKSFEDCKAIIDGARPSKAQPAEAVTMDEKERAVYELFKKFMSGDKQATEEVGAMLAKKAA